MDGSALLLVSEAFDCIGDGILIVDSDSFKIEAANKAACSMLGYKYEDLVQLSVRDLHKADFCADVYEIIRRQLQGHPIAVNVPFSRRDGTIVNYDVNTTIFEVEGEKYLVGVLRDPSPRQNLEKELNRERAASKTYLDITDAILVALDPDGRILMINKKGCQKLGYTQAEAEGLNWFDSFTPMQKRDEVKVFYKSLIAREGEAEPFRSPVLAKNGRLLSFLWQNSVIRDEQGKVTGTLSSGTDISDMEALQEQVQQMQKMDAVGRLAGGIAHDYNNLLMGIRGCCDLISAGLYPDHPAQAELKEIKLCVQRGADLNDQILTFCRKQLMQPKNLDVNALVLGMKKMLSRLIGESIPIRIAAPDSACVACVDKVKLEQVIMNMVINARDAITKNGLIDISVAKEFIRAGAHSSASRDGWYVRIDVKDNGSGMDDGILKMIFEPFFTTKAVGGGTGLGLATSYGIVKQSNGFINVTSRKGEGSCFSIFLPLVNEPASHEREEISGSVEGGKEAILVVEDEDPLRKIIVRMLVSGGYNVTGVGSARRALDILQKDSEIKLVLSDVIMPGMNGAELAKTIMANHRGVKVIMMSGYTDGHLDKIRDLHRDKAFIQKPCSRDVLLRTIRNTLDDAP